MADSDNTPAIENADTPTVTATDVSNNGRNNNRSRSGRTFVTPSSHPKDWKGMTEELNMVLSLKYEQLNL